MEKNAVLLPCKAHTVIFLNRHKTKKNPETKCKTILLDFSSYNCMTLNSLKLQETYTFMAMTYL